MATTFDADRRSRATSPKRRAAATAPLRTSSTSDARSSSRSFRPDVEGLRALGVLLVVAFHASVPHLAGGFVGVDVFFVISGFLITGLLVREGVARGRISLQDFYARRIRRILPAACLVLVATVPLMLLTFDPLRTYRSLLDLAAALLYVSNWRFIHQNNDYLAASNDHSPALHYWSLSVEEQFYLVWPLLIVVCVALCRRYRWRVSRVALVVLGLVSVASFVANLRLTVSDPSLAYLATQTRAWQFGVGGLLALLVYGGPAWLSSRGASALRWVVGWAGLVAVGATAYLYTNDTTYPGMHALLPTLGTAAIILGGSTAVGAPAPRRSVTGLFSWAPVRWVGRMSYAWYLWHWPLIVCAEARWPDLTLAARVGVMLVGLVLAWLTFVLLERPVLRSGFLRRSRPASVSIGLAATLVCGAVFVPVGLHARDQLGVEASRTKDPSFEQAFGASTRTSGAVTPSVLRAADDQPPRRQCLLQATQRTQPTTCSFGPVDGAPVVLFGDSHAHQWESTFIALAKKHDWRLTVVAHGGCSPAVLYSTARSKFAKGCLAWREDQLDRIPALKPKIVFIGSLNRYTSNRPLLEAGWRETFDRLGASGAKLVYLYDTPWPGRDVPSCVSSHLDDWSACDLALSAADDFDFATQEHRIMRDFPDVDTVDLTDTLCVRNTCPAVRNGILIYRDFSHISDTAARLLVVPLEKRLARQKIFQAAR